MFSGKRNAPKPWLKRSLAVLTVAGVALAGFGFVQAQQEEEDETFSIVVLPDTQYYTSERHGGKAEMFYAQTDWIKKNHKKENIAYVVQIGDIVDSGEKVPAEWERAAKAMYALEEPLPGLPHGIPYGVTVGNHDQRKSQFAVSSDNTSYNKYFGVAHFQGRKYYGGHYAKNDNDSHYDFFKAGGMDFMVIHVEFDAFDEDIENTNAWVCNLLEKYPNHKVIIASHFIVVNNATAGTNEKGFAPYGKQGARLHDRIKRYPNVFMAFCGHVGDNGEGYRRDFYAGHSMQTMLTDYQSRPNGGDGLMRLITFSKKKDLISVRTFSPYTGVEEKDDDSQFTKPWMHGTNVVRQFDYNNDRFSELSFFNKGQWTIAGMSDPISFGKEGDIPVPADYNGDGQTDLAVFNATEGKFTVQGGKEIMLGQAGDIPVPGDYDGDGYADVAVYRPSNYTWYVNGMKANKHGNKDAIPVPADYDGDGVTEMAFFRTGNSMWQIAEIGNVPFGQADDIPVPGDYDGDGRAEMAVYRPSTGEFVIDKMKAPVKLGQPGDIPVPGNYLGDGKIHPAVYRNGQLILDTRKVIAVSGNGEVVNLPYAIKRLFFK